MRTAGAPSGGRGDFAARGGRAVQSGGDGALAHKTTRDFRKDGKDRERSREERRELGHGRGEAVGRNAQGGKKQFNRVPKALQNRTPVNTPKKEEVAVTEIRIPERITVRDLAERMHIPGAQIVKELFMKGDMVTLNHELPYEKAEEIAIEHDIICEKEEREDVIGALLAEDAENESEMTPRPPVVCVMGHVDHGKTSLLDAIRNTNVTDKEAGGITQHIGAYMVSVHGQKITFLDTPGHEAFTAMRMRGANATDIAVLVVAADDGVMPQTVEAINHAKAAEVEIIVAVNKIDKPGANVDRVKQELTEYGLIAEDWGGSTVFCPVSAKTQEGIDNLLEMILLTAEVQELKANANRKARGIVLEAKLDKGRGPVASILIQKGTLHQGDFIACGAASGKVRAMTDEKGKRLQKATPSMPVEIEYIFHSQIQAVQLHKTQHHCAIAATSSRQASPHLLALFAPAKATPKRGHPIPPTRPGPQQEQTRTLRAQLVGPPQVHLRKLCYSFYFLWIVKCGLVSAPPGPWAYLGGADRRASLNHRIWSSGRQCGHR